MAISKFNNPHVPASVLAESTGNKTYNNHLKALYSAFAALSDEQKKMTAIIIDTDIYKISDISSTAAFSRTSGNTSATSLFVSVIRVNNSAASLTRWEITTSGTTRTAVGEDAYNGTVQLVYGI